MGAHPYFYFTAYQHDIDAALQALREQEFRTGHYEPALWMAIPPAYTFQLRFPPDATWPAPGARHASIEAAIEAGDGLGTGSILDIRSITPEPAHHAASPVSDGVVIELLGTSRPTRKQLQSRLFSPPFIERFWKATGFGEARYVILYASGTPSEIFFAGYPLSSRHDDPESREHMDRQRFEMAKPEIAACFKLIDARFEVGDLQGALRARETGMRMLEEEERRSILGNIVGFGLPWSLCAFLLGLVGIGVGLAVPAIKTLHPVLEWTLVTGAAAVLLAGAAGLTLFIVPILVSAGGPAGFVLCMPLLIIAAVALTPYAGNNSLPQPLDWLILTSMVAVLYALMWVGRALAQRFYWRIWALRLRGKRTMASVIRTRVAPADEGGPARWLATVAFVTAKAVRCEEDVQIFYDRSIAPGHALPLRYDRADPSNFKVFEKMSRLRRVGSFLGNLVFVDLLFLCVLYYLIMFTSFVGHVLLKRFLSLLS